MALDELVSRSFVLIQADAMAGVVRGELARVTATHVIVARHEADTQYWYLFPIEQARAMLRGDRDGPIVDAFGLHEWTASPTVEAGGDAATAPVRAVVLRGGQAVGFIDRVFQAAGGAPGPGGGTAARPPVTGPFTRGG